MRGGRRGMYLGRRGGGAAPLTIALATVGTYARASGEKGGCNGSSATLAWYAAGARCYEDRGDGAGALLVFEGAYKQWLLQNQAYDSASWTKTTPTVGADATTGPDGTSTADSLTTATTSVVERVTQTPAGSGAGISDAARCCISLWAKDAAGDIFRLSLTDKAAALTHSSNLTPTAAWARYYFGIAAGTGAANVIVRCPNNGSSAAIRAWDGMTLGQFDVGEYFPCRTVRSAGSMIDVSADSLTLTAGEGAMLFTGSWRIQEVSLDGADSERNTASVYDLWSVDADNRVSVEHDGADWRVRAYSGGALKASSVPIAWAAYGLLGAVDVKPSSGLIAIDGIDGAAGTAWTWTPAASRFGGRVSGANELRGRIHPTIVRV
jgi:hypothetical protein